MPLLLLLPLLLPLLLLPLLLLLVLVLVLLPLLLLLLLPLLPVLLLLLLLFPAALLAAKRKEEGPAPGCMYGWLFLTRPSLLCVWGCQNRIGETCATTQS